MNILVDKIIETLQAQLKDSRGIARFYFGNPEDLASADLPCIFVQPLSKKEEQLDNVYDLVTAEVMIGVCVDVGKYSRKNTNEGTAERFLSEIEGGRNTDGTPIQKSVTYVLRNLFTLEGTVLYQEQNTVWGERELTGGVAKEIHMYFTFKYKVRNTS
jgi:hypothetical protein